MTYTEQLNEYLESLTWKQSKSRLNLDEIKSIAHQLDIYPEPQKTRVITITGTNGKGSCTEMLTSVYVDAGYSVGTYTSPHLFDFNERIRIQKNPVDDEILCKAFNMIEKGRGNHHLTYFETITLAALWIFKQANVQIILLEVGIGGRLDATNIVDADLALITSIGLDHLHYLGSTREAIGREKAGIFRANAWAVCGDLMPPASVGEVAQKLGTKIVYIGKDFFYDLHEKSWDFSTENLNTKCILKDLPLPNLFINNATTVLQAIIMLNQFFPVNIGKAVKSITQTSLPGRCELKQITTKKNKTISVIFDVAHNPQAVSHLADFLKRYKLQHPYKKTYAIFSMLSDKDIEGTLCEIKNQIDEWHIAEINMPRAASKEQLEKAFASQAILPIWYKNLESAYYFLENQLMSNDILVVFGSFSVITEIPKKF